MSNSSSDDDLFHSASDGEQNVEDSTSVSTRASSPKLASFTDSKESNDSFEKVEKQKKEVKDDKSLFKVPDLPIQRCKKSSKSNNKSHPGFKNEMEVNTCLADESDDEDDWFKAQMDEFKKSDLKERTTACTERKYSDVDNEKQKNSNKSIWEWTGIHEVVNAVGEGLSNVVEAGLGLPHAEEMAKLSVAERRKLMEEAQHMKEPEPSLSSDEGLAPDSRVFRQKKSNLRHHQTSGTQNELPSDAEETTSHAEPVSFAGGFFSTGGLFSTLVSAPLDVLESLGKKTFDTLTVKNENDGDKRYFFLRGETSDQSLSELLRELREEKEETTARYLYSGYENSETGRFNVNFVSLFEKNEGMVHLEGLELLSKDQERRTKALTNSRLFDETLLEFCVEDVSECTTEDFNHEFSKSVKFISLPYKPTDVLETNRSLTQELSLRQAAVDANEEIVVDGIHEAAITALAKLTAHSISALHKIAQLIIIAKDLPEIDSLFALTYLLCRRLSFFATQYTNILNLVESSSRVDEVVTNIFFECSNSCHYVKKALELLRPFFKKC